jgi:TonB-linked SusC/RagA family outer membrane protein
MKFCALIKGRPEAWPLLNPLLVLCQDLTSIDPVLKKRIIMRMKLTMLMIIMALVQVSAHTYGQNITLNEKNVSLEKVLKSIKEQSGYVFFYDASYDQLKISVNIKNAPIQDVLKACFEQTDLSFKIAGKTVLLRRDGTQRNEIKAVKEDLELRGRVMDTDGKPLVGATVKIENTSKGGFTDSSGEFYIKGVPEGSTLTISYLGYVSQQVVLSKANAKSLEITLQPSAGSLREVVVNTGFQLVRKEKMTGATVSVSSAELEKRYTPNILDNLEGKVPGLVNYRGVTSIRGVSTINASKLPLIVLDGLPIEGSIADINPYDVEDITLLKDAAAAAIYGARAANGVIVITTKRAKGNKISIEASSDVTISDKPDLNFNLLTPSQQIDLEQNAYKYLFANTGGPYPNTAAAIAGTANGISNGTPVTPLQYAYYQLARGAITQSQLEAQVAGFRQNNFRDQYREHALLNNVLQQYNFALRSGGERFQSSLIVNYKNDNSGIINAYNRKLNIFYKGSYKLSNWLEANYGVNTVLGYIKASNSNFATRATNVSPYQQLLDSDGNHVYYTTGEYNSYNTNAATQPVRSLLVNHLEELEKDARKTTQQNTRYYLNFKANVLPGLTFTPQFQYENNNLSTSAYAEEDSYVMRYLKSIYTTLLPASGGKLATTSTKGDYWTARGQAQYQRSFGKHAFDAIAGTEFRQTKIKGIAGLLLGYDDQLQSQSTTSVSYPALSAFQSTTTFKPGFNTAALYGTFISSAIGVIPETVHRFNSNYANMTYTYNDRYNVFGSYRVDYADVFGLDEKFRGKPLWSAGLGWNLHQESFLSEVAWLTFLKLRATYGITGNIVQGVSSFLTANSSFINPITNLPMSAVTNAANPELRWEKTATSNLGLDFTLFSSRLNGALDWYRKKGSDLLVTQRLDPSEGFSNQIINNGGLLNNGIELSLQYSWLKPERKDGLRWSSSVVISRNKNRITYIDEVSTTPLALAQSGYKVGNPVNSLFSYQYKGLSASGQPQWLTGSGTLSTIALTSNDLSAMKYSGSTDPQININLSNDLYYKGFSLYVQAVYYGGQYLRALVPEVLGGVPYGSMPAYTANSWTPGNTNTIVPGFGQYAPGIYPGTQGPPPSQLNFSDAFVRSGDFLKIRSATLAYQLPRMVTEKMGSASIKLRFQVNNPKALWTGNDVGIDPETGGARIPTSYVFGINVNY